MKPFANKKIKFFGCPMDCDEKYESIQEKLSFLKTNDGIEDPLEGVMALLTKDPAFADISSDSWENHGSRPVPDWLSPTPGPELHSKVTTENFIEFIDNDGCRSQAQKLDQYVTDTILPDIPVMVGIDHSLTGGIYSALARHYGKENLSLVIIDSHTDAVPMSALSGAVQYDAENNPDSVHDSDDPFLYNRPDSYNASSFVNCMLKDQTLDPKNLYLIGVSDFPEKKSLKVKDPRIKRYNNAYLGLRRKGAKIIAKKECKLSPKKIKGLLSKISTPFVYVSIDMDIGANNALDGVRFRNWTGLNEKAIYKIADILKLSLNKTAQLVGMDICEIDPRRAGLFLPSGKDRTYEIAANLIKNILFNNQLLPGQDSTGVKPAQ